jgi:MFS transporter, DHA1 family, multidrug resistance protein
VVPKQSRLANRRKKKHRHVVYKCRAMNSFKATTFSALALAFASLGDAFLYPFLPAGSGHVGMPVAWVGLILSINRFVRIFSNSLMVILFSKFGRKQITIVAVILAIFSTAGYSVARGLLLWIFLRVLWGLSFSALRISTISYATDHVRKGFGLGISKSLQETGPMLALISAPFLIGILDPHLIFVFLAVASLPAIYFAIRLPQNKHPNAPPTLLKDLFRIPSIFNVLTFASSFVIDGIVIVSLGILFIEHGEGITALEATIMASFFLGYRRIASLVFAPIGGLLADKSGLNKVFVVSSVLTIAGLLLLTMGFTKAGAIVVFTFYSVQSTLAPGNSFREKEFSLQAVAENATWRDLGAALGTLCAGLLVSSPYLSIFFIPMNVVLVLLLLVYLASVSNKFKLLLSWK